MDQPKTGYSPMNKTRRVQQGQRYAQRLGIYTRTAVWEVGSVRMDTVPIPHARLVNVEDPLRTKTISCLTLANPTFYEFLGEHTGIGA